ncbi:MAG TPA: hypothetical protein VNJ52_04940 [Patescibacteria group bacterium]|nr:hypothetical protein [Patescibacteria group bacterium]
MNDDRTTAREIAQDKMNGDIMLALGRLEGQMSGVKESIDNLAPVIKDFENRITENEKDLSTIRVKIGIIGAVIGAAVSFIINWTWSKFRGY